MVAYIPPGGWLKVAGGLTACTPGSPLGPTSSLWENFTLLYIVTVRHSIVSAIKTMTYRRAVVLPVLSTQGISC